MTVFLIINAAFLAFLTVIWSTKDYLNMFVKFTSLVGCLTSIFFLLIQLGYVVRT